MSLHANLTYPVNEQNGQNEQNRRGRKIALVQIAGILARRIVCQLKGGERVEQGARYGMIMLGSRVDVYCPPDVALKVEIGQRVKAGETILGVYPQSWLKAWSKARSNDTAEKGKGKIA